jgi:chromosome segregation ATPase
MWMLENKVELEESQLGFIEKSVKALDDLIEKLYDQIDECTDSDEDFVRCLSLRENINRLTEIAETLEEEYLLVPSA